MFRRGGRSERRSQLIPCAGLCQAAIVQDGLCIHCVLIPEPEPEPEPDLVDRLQ